MFDDLKRYDSLLLVACLSTLAVFLARLCPTFAAPVTLLRYGVLFYALVDATSPASRSRGSLIVAGQLLGWLGGNLDVVQLYAVHDPQALITFPVRLILLPGFFLYLLAKMLHAHSEAASRKGQ